MRFLADESCDFTVVRGLRAAGHEVIAVAEVAPGASDEVVIDLAVREARVLLTEDKDFGQLVFASTLRSPGVIFVRFPPHARGTLAKAVADYVSGQEDLAGLFVVVQPGRIRTARSPRG